MNSDVGQEFRRDIPISNGNLGVLCRNAGGQKSTGGGFHCSGSTHERMGRGGGAVSARKVCYPRADI